MNNNKSAVRLAIMVVTEVGKMRLCMKFPLSVDSIPKRRIRVPVDLTERYIVCCRIQLNDRLIL